MSVEDPSGGAVAYAALLAHLRQTEALSQVAGLLSWDQEAVMPPGGASARAEQAGALAAVLHARRGDPRVAEWCAAIDPAGLDAAGRANLREAGRAYRAATRVPQRLAEALAHRTAAAQGVWAEARAASDWPAFRPVLAEIVALKREEAACLAEPGQAPYDALLDQFEADARGDDLAAMFDALRPGLQALSARIAACPAPPVPEGTFPAGAQMALARAVAAQFGYELDAGRIDLVVHPFCSGTRGDVRITTRVDEADPLNCLYSTIHETGHALYEQGLDPALAFQPAGRSVSMGIHESQSRLCENQVGRSRAFCTWLWPRMQAAFGDMGLDGAEALYRAVNRAGPGFIRTEADEVHYNLHIMLRFDLERALIAGDLEVADLEAAWNDRFAADFGRAVPDAARGVLQDVHWSVGLFGYFPTYTLGNLHAACLWQALLAARPGVEAGIAAGSLGPVRAWLGEAVHAHGSCVRPAALIEAATGRPPSPAPLLAYLEEKFSGLYALAP